MAQVSSTPSGVPGCTRSCSDVLTNNPFSKGQPLGHLIENIIQSNSWVAREPALKLYTKIVSNILSNPLEPKYRKLNIEKVIGKFGADFKGIAELLKQVGFQATQDGNLILPDSVVTEPLCQSLCVWSDREAKSAAGRAEAERIRLENMSDVDKLKAAKDAARAQVKSLSAQARQDVAAKPVNASVGNKIAFGSTLVKTAPPPPEKKGG